MMIAHSLPDPFFGPAQQLHGATYITDVVFSSKTLNSHNVVIDIGKAHEILTEALAPLQYKNLDEIPHFKGHLTTTEFLAKYIHDRIKEKVKGHFEGPVSVILGESHIASATYSDDTP